MKKLLLISSLVAAAGTLSAWAATPTTVDLAYEYSTNASYTGGRVTTLGSGTTYTITNDGTSAVDCLMHMRNIANTANTAAMGELGSVSFEGTVSGGGTLEIYYLGGNYGVTYTFDLTNSNFSGFTGQLALVNSWNNSTLVKVSGTNFSGVEYLFAGLSQANTWTWRRGYNDTGRGQDTLHLADDTTFAGISGTEKNYSAPYELNKVISGGWKTNPSEHITAESAGTTLTTAGAGTYAYYGYLGTADVAISLNHTGEGTQTFGGTNYLQDVSVSKGVLNLEGTTTITGTAGATDTGTLNVAGALTIAADASVNLSGSTVDGTIANSGALTISDATKFVLDDLTGTFADDTFTYQVITTASSSTGALTVSGTLSSSQFYVNGEALNSRWVVSGTDSNNLLISSGALALTWNSGDWNSSGANFKNASDEDTIFANGDSVTFKTDSNPSVAVVGSHSVQGLKIEKSTTLTGTGNVTVGSSFSIAQDQTLAWNAGTLDISSSTNTLTGTLSIGKEALVLAPQLTSAGATFNLAGTGTIQMSVGTGNYNKTLSVGDFAGKVVLVGTSATGGAALGNNTFGVLHADGINSSKIGSNVTLVLDGSIIVAAGLNTIAAAVEVKGSNVYFYPDTGDDKGFTFTNSVTVDEGAKLTSANGKVTISGDFSNAGTLAVSSTLNSSGKFTNTGTTTVSGTLNLTGTATNSGTLTASGTLDVSKGSFTNKGTGTTTVTGTLSGNGTINVDSGDFKVTAVTTHTFSGAVNIKDGGTFLLGKDDTDTALALINSAATFTVYSGGTLLLNNGGTSTTSTTNFGNNVTLKAGSTLKLKDGYLTLSGNINFDGDNTTAISVSQLWNKNHNFSGVLSGQGKVTLSSKNSGDNTTGHIFTISGANNTFSGTYYVESASSTKYATLKIANANAISAANVELGENSVLQVSAADASLKDLSGKGQITSPTEKNVLTVDTISGYATAISFGANVTLKILQAMTENATITGASGASVIANTGTLGNISVTGATATVTLSQTVTQGAITLNNSAKIVIADNFKSPENALTASVDETKTINIIAASALKVADVSDWTSVTEFSTYFDYDTEIYQDASFAVEGGIIQMTYAIPEPSMFGLLAGALALGLAGTRRRRKATK